MDQFMPVTIESDPFAAMKADMTAALSSLLRLMQSYGENKAQLTLKLNVSLESGMDGESSVVVPIFEHKVTTTVQRKDEIGGELGGDLALVKDAHGGFVLRPFNGQVDMFNPDSWGSPEDVMR